MRVAWDTRIQRKVAIKCIELDEVDAARAALPGANAVAQRAPQHEPLPWEDDPVFNDADEAEGDATSVFDLVGDGPLVHSLAHVPGLDEARTAAMLSDASIVAVYDLSLIHISGFRDRFRFMASGAEEDDLVGAANTCLLYTSRCV